MRATPTSPQLGLERFDCPHCAAFSHQVWGDLKAEARYRDGAGGLAYTSVVFADVEGALEVLGTQAVTNRNSSTPSWAFSLCSSCNQSAVWRGSRMVFPDELTVASPHELMPPQARELYDQARATLPVSRRAAAALARACLESLLRELDAANKGKRLDDMLAQMHDRLGDGLWKLLTALRVVGNDALHGDSDELVVMFLDGDKDVVIEPLFGAINAIVEKEIAQPAHTEALYALIPQPKREAAEAKAAGVARGASEGE